MLWGDYNLKYTSTLSGEIDLYTNLYIYKTYHIFHNDMYLH